MDITRRSRISSTGSALMKQDAEEAARRRSRIDSTGPILKPSLIDDIPYADDEVIQSTLIAYSDL